MVRQPIVASVVVSVHLCARQDIFNHEALECRLIDVVDDGGAHAVRLAVLRSDDGRLNGPRAQGNPLCLRGCLRCLLLVMCTHPFAKEALTLHLARSEGHERYFGCNLMHRKVLALSHQHLMAEAPKRTQ